MSDPVVKYTFEIRDALGAPLIRQTEGEYNWTPESEIHIGLSMRIAYQIRSREATTIGCSSGKTRS